MVDLPAQRSARGPDDTAGPRVEQLPGAVIAVDLESRVVAWSAGAQELYGWTAEEAVGQNVRELIGLVPERADEVKAALHAGRSWSGEFRTLRKDGTPMLVWVSNGPVRDDAGDVVGVVGVSLDITSYASALTARAEQLQDARARAELLADRNARLVRLSEALGAALEDDAIAAVVVRHAVDALHVDAGGVTVIDQRVVGGSKGGRLRVLASVGYEPEVVATYESLPLEAATPLTDLLRAGEPVRTESRQELVDRYPHLPHSSLSESIACVPLEVEGRVLGVLAVSSVRPAAFGDDDVVFLLTLARQGAQAMERGRLLAAEREARRRVTFLAMASARLATSLDFHQTIDAVAALAVPAAGDWCSVHLLDEHGAPQLVTVHHRDPELQDLLTELFVRYPPDPGRGSGIGQAVGEQRTVHHSAFPDEVVRAIARDPWHYDALTRLGLGSALVVPLQVVGRTIGVLTLTSEQQHHYTEADVELVEDLARRMATAVDNALRYRQERETALTLQRSLLPRALPELPGLTVAHRYRPGTAGAEVGGDWYDLVPLTRGRVGLVIGDVMGRGIAAAAVMGQLRAAVRACALVEDSPSAVLGLVDAAMSSLGQTSLTTCLYGVLDPATATLRLASAGHLPPLVVHRDGGGQYVELEPGPPLGVGTAPPSETVVHLPEGALLLLFTDGLVEGRAQPVEEGLLALRNAVAELGELEPSGVEQLCDTLLRVMGRDGRPDDDSAMLAVLTGGEEPADAGAHLHLAGHLSEVARARRLAVEWAERTGCDPDDAALLVTEVATNALRHGGPGVDLWVRRPAAGGLRVELIDGRSDALPQARQPGPDAEGGRGLLIVGALARAWGSERLSAGKCVWFELDPLPG
ncbi:MAG: Serine phosphatase RsbU, regulator of sigma subunit [uncultured Frankineae bacterium]|uniref:protein-serine/threonine phosphatase n=1 Tax=uncultured Frankineae bacterium TaxID=437475 RepID=A0A6J4KT70_9ACTN|nr:MAG: Serine phosphatase RsbU, regulator of sigma subunit [uncultured Frankineae bacterium]